MRKIHLPEKTPKIRGRYQITTMENGVPVAETDWIENLILSGETSGLGLIARAIAGETIYPIAVTSAEIGTGTTAPATSDTNLETPVLTDIPPRTQAVTNATVTLTFFIPDGALPNGTYTEFLLRCGEKPFARSLIAPEYEKGTKQDAIISYEITLS